MIGDNLKGETLYRWNISSDILDPIYVWKGFGEKETHSVYKGGVENGNPNGLGFMIHPEGDKYVGSWKNGLRNGKGTLTFTNGGKYIGEYKNDEVWTGIFYNEDGNNIGKFVNGGWKKP